MLRRLHPYSFLLTACLWLLSIPASFALTPIEVEKLLASDGWTGDSFGLSVAVSGNTAVIGAPFNDYAGHSAGSAYVFVREADGGWREQAKLTANGGAFNGDAWFGWSVAVSGDTAVIGAPGSPVTGAPSGSAYVFERQADGSWSEQARLTPSNGSEGDLFGRSVAVAGNTAVIGARHDDDAGSDAGAAYVFVRDAIGSWSEQVKLTAGDAAASDSFGASVAMSGDTAVIGAVSYDGTGSGSGSAYVFVHGADGSWHEQAKLIGGSTFGWSVAVAGDTAAVGAPEEGSNRTGSGSAYVFEREFYGDWHEQARLTASDDSALGIFGNSVAVSGDTVVIGAPGTGDAGIQSGSAYLFEREVNGSWREQAKITASDGAAYDRFGGSVAVSGSTAVIGARQDDDFYFDSGSAYVFDLSSDGDGDGVLDDSDNCPSIANPDQSDNDGDLQGDVCDSDDDNDGFSDELDNCPFSVNLDQADSDGDGFGDACDADVDGDSVDNLNDNCPLLPNPEQTDTDGDGEGDACDADDDNDAFDDSVDNCPLTVNNDQLDQDGDGLGDACDIDIDGDGVDNSLDNCPVDANSAQDDSDEDGNGDACDPDIDGDSVLNDLDNCRMVANPDQSDVDNDGLGDACDSFNDNDADGIENSVDNCPAVANPSQNDLDGDGEGDACDIDIDGDGVANGNDLCADTPSNEIVSPDNGCSIAQLVPCDGPMGSTEQWKNHGQYVSLTAQTAQSFWQQGLISLAQRNAIDSAATHSSCGDAQ